MSAAFFHNLKGPEPLLEPDEYGPGLVDEQETPDLPLSEGLHLNDRKTRRRPGDS
jgi:hypothetical protein